MNRSSPGAKSQLIGAAFGLLIVVFAAGCSASRERQMKVDPADIARQLALACHNDWEDTTPERLEKVSPEPPRGDRRAENCAAAPLAAAQRRATSARLPIGGGTDTRRQEDSVNQIATGTLPEPPPGPGRMPPPLVLRYSPESARLRPADAAALSREVARLVATDTIKWAVTVGRAGSGNAFDQATSANARLQAIKEMLPPHVLGSLAFDPSLPDDTVSFRAIEAPHAEPDAR